MGLPIIFLNIGLIIALLCWINFKKYYSRKLLRLYLAAIAVQFAHFLEEYYTGFYKIFPSFFNASPWSANQFVIFNITWLIIFLISAIGAFKNVQLSFVPLWFFIIVGCFGNALLHISASLFSGKYFSGTFTAFFLLLMGVIMLKELLFADNNSVC